MACVLPDENGASPDSIGMLVRARAETSPDRVAVTFLREDGQRSSWTYGELYARAMRVAECLRELGPAGSRALLLYPAGMEFLAGFCGCSLAGWTPVPTCYPKPGRAMGRLDSIATACQPRVVLTDRDTAEKADPSRWTEAARDLPLIPTDALESVDVGELASRVNADAPAYEGLGLLQFTSGSTSRPKGVMVSDANLMSNLEAIRVGFGLSFEPATGPSSLSGVFWLPAFHDMGLIGGLLTPLYLGGHVVIQSPRDFLSQPLRWLRAVAEFGATVTGAPNFAYQLCVDRIDGAQSEGLDLSCLQVAFCGAEPVQPDTLERFASRFAHTGFSRSALMPCYGLAEATLYVAGCRPGEPRTVLTVDRTALEHGQLNVLQESREAASGAGKAAVKGTVRLMTSGSIAERTEVCIVDRESKRRVAAGQIGEIWVRGASVARGYWPPAEWGQTHEDHQRFSGRLSEQNGAGPSGENGPGGENATYCQTGDLGFLHGDQLFVTGRSKDLIILRGRNHYPQDIELTIQEALAGDVGTVVAFAADGPAGEGLVVVAETDRHADPERFPTMAREIRRAIIDQHEVDPRQILLLRPAAIPMTTSGKVQRSACRQQFLEQRLVPRHRWDRNELRVDGAPMPAPALPGDLQKAGKADIAAAIRQWLIAWLSQRTGVDESSIEPDATMDALGLDSFTSVEMSGAIEDWLGIRLTPEVAFSHPTPATLAEYLADALLDREVSG